MGLVALKDRLEQIQLARGYESLRALSLACGLSHGTLFAAAERDRIGGDTAMKLEQKTGFRARWIQDGEGNPTLDPSEQIPDMRFPFFDAAKVELVRHHGVDPIEAERLLRAAIAFDEGVARSGPFDLMRLALMIRAGVRGRDVGVREVDD